MSAYQSSLDILSSAIDSFVAIYGCPDEAIILWEDIMMANGWEVEQLEECYRSLTSDERESETVRMAADWALRRSMS